MRVKAIGDLAQLSDTELFEQVAEGLKLCFSNAAVMLEDAEVLATRERARGAEILRQAAEEEASKILVLLDAVRCPRATNPDAFARQLQYFNDHLAKGIYVEVSRWRPANFAEVRKGVDRERKEFYLDGPNDVDWIFYNDILRRREEAIYVSYVENDGDHIWHDPNSYGKLGVISAPGHSPTMKIARSLSEAGLFSAAALAELAFHWRAIEIEDAMRWMTLRSHNFSTLERLDRKGLLVEASSDCYAVIANEWPFPLYPLDLRKDLVKKDSLRAIQDQWGPYDV